MRLKPLGIVKEIIESIGIGISYAYDDLVFVDHNAFLFQFTHKSNEIALHVNRDADEKEVAHSINLMNNAAAERGMAIKDGKYYALVQVDDENVRLEFLENNN
ncbi:MAG: hypothetical protein OEM01_07635 [Desulfobulbaceae bacterium]|nr:hypothetical protein [Desulfobulbaceae bacterium]